MLSLEDLFCHVDDFCQTFEPLWNTRLLEAGLKTRNRSSGLCLSERMTILIAFHQMGYRTFKDFYQKLVQPYWHEAFPGLVSYSRFVQLLPSTLFPLCAYLRYCFGSNTGVSFIDSTKLKVCHNRRISQHRTFSGQAARGRTSVDWFFGFKLHLVVNDCGELLNMTLTPGNVDDRKPVAQLVQSLTGKLFGDKGYISKKLSQQLWQTTGIQLITPLKKNMKNRLLPLWDKLLLRRRSIIETILDQLKNISQIEHTRHRSPVNFLINLLAGLIAYCHQPKKPSLRLERVLPAIA